jgi:hypothetical protein
MELGDSGAVTLSIEAHGVPISIELPDSSLVARVDRILPPGHVPADPAQASVAFRLGRETAETFSLAQGPQRLVAGVGADDAIRYLDGAIRESIAAQSPQMIFIHAGVVAHGGRGLVLPGATFTGKTELVVALLRAGASYYSDEFAVLDSDGLVHPYPRRLSVRDRATGVTRDLAAEELGAPTGATPVRASVIAVTRYVRQSSWQPATLTPALGLMRLLAHAGQARSDPERALAAVHRAATRAITLEGPRGEAEPTALALLAQLDARRDR